MRRIASAIRSTATTLEEIIAVIHYGGRVTDFLDLRCVKTLFSDLFKNPSQQILKYLPASKNCSLEELNAFVRKLNHFLSKQALIQRARQLIQSSELKVRKVKQMI